MTLPGDLAQDYAAALVHHLATGGEASLHQSYQLGRRALDEGLGLLDLALLHHDTLGEFLIDHPGDDEQTAMVRAAEFFAECLSPFEMTLLGYRESNLRLSALNDKLAKASAATEAANRQLSAEIAERQRAEEALWQAQRLQAVGRLAGGVAHHFNNLLTVAMGNLALAQETMTGNPALESMLGAAARAVDRGARVTRQLLAFSRQQMLRPEVIQSPARLADIATLLSGALRNNITIETDLPGDLWAVEIDPAELELAILNLGLNARDAMPDGGVLRIAARNASLNDERLSLAGNYLVIEVSDTGTGISAEVLPRVFDPFFTTKGAGTGLGLSQVHGFAHQSGGAVDVESAPGKGTTIRLHLPASRRAAEGVVEAAPEAPAASPQDEASDIVLVVEDDLDVAALAADLIRHLGFTVKLAYRAKAALDLLRNGEKVDLIFSDIVMPDGMSGIELAEEVKSRFPEVPVLLATGYSEALADASSKGLTIIAKPYQPQELSRRIAGLLRS